MTSCGSCARRQSARNSDISRSSHRATSMGRVATPWRTSSPDRGCARGVACDRGRRHVAPRLSFSGSLSNGRGQVPVIVEGVDPSRRRRIGTSLTMVAGVPLEPRRRSGRDRRRRCRACAGAPSGRRRHPTGSDEGRRAQYAGRALAGVFRSPFKDYDALAARIKLSDAQELVGADSVNSLVVLLAPGTHVEAAIGAARHALPSDRYDIRAWWDLADFYQGTAALYRRQFLVLLVIVSLMVLLSVANSIGMSLHERQCRVRHGARIGLPSGDGVPPDRHRVALLGACAALVGVVAGVLLAWGISAVGIADAAAAELRSRLHRDDPAVALWPGAARPWLDSWRRSPGPSCLRGGSRACPSSKPCVTQSDRTSACSFASNPVDKTYRLGVQTVVALRHVSLNIEEGAFIAISGPSGSGKSTLLNIIGLIDTPTSGRLLIDDREVSGRSPDELSASCARARSGSSSRRSTCCRC